MARKKENMTPRSLQLGDSVYQVVKTQLDEHLDNSDNDLLSYHINAIKVKSLRYNPDKEGHILINDKISLPEDGRFATGEVGETIIDEEEAKALIVSLIKKELVKAERQLQHAKERLAGVKSNLSVYDNDKPIQADDVVVRIGVDNAKGDQD